MATATLERPRPTKYAAEQEGEFVVVHDVPLFDEHMGPDGESYDRESLAGMVEVMNERIADTGDFTPIVLNHTPTNREKLAGIEEPDVVGLAGPYYLGILGTRRPRWCIFARDWRIYRDRATEAERRPRRSVEVWRRDTEGNDLPPPKRFFDPICLCGAETPRRDLGLVRYRRDGEPDRYEASVASATNAYLPSACAGQEGKKKPNQLPAATDADSSVQKYEKESTAMALSPEDLQQIVEAMRPVIQAVVAEMTAPEDDSLELGDPDAMADQGAADDAAANAVPGQDPEMNAAGAMPGGGQDAGGMGAAGAADPAMAAAGAMGGAMPGAGGDAPTKPVERYQRERDEFRDRYQAAKRERDDFKDRYERAEKERTTLLREKNRVERYSKLKEFEQQGFVIDCDDEIVDVAEMSEPDWAKHQKRIERYQRVPFGTLPRSKTPPMPAAAERANLETSGKAKDYAQKHGCSYAEALEKVTTAA